MIAKLKFLFGIHRTDPRVAASVDRHWQFAAQFLDISKPGKPPPMMARLGPWKVDGQRVYGLYRYFRIWRWVLKDAITVVYLSALDSQTRLDATTVHEMVHALRRRRGLPVDHSITARAEVAVREANSS